MINLHLLKSGFVNPLNPLKLDLSNCSGVIIASLVTKGSQVHSPNPQVATWLYGGGDRFVRIGQWTVPELRRAGRCTHPGLLTLPDLVTSASTSSSDEVGRHFPGQLERSGCPLPEMRAKTDVWK